LLGKTQIYSSPQRGIDWFETKEYSKIANLDTRYANILHGMGELAAETWTQADKTKALVVNGYALLELRGRDCVETFFDPFANLTAQFVDGTRVL
jgi:hypothetical protein